MEHRCPEPPDKVDSACFHERPLSYAVAWLESNGWKLEQYAFLQDASRSGHLN